MDTSSKCLLTTAMVSSLSLAAHGAAVSLPTPPTQFLPVAEGRTSSAAPPQGEAGPSHMQLSPSG